MKKREINKGDHIIFIAFDLKTILQRDSVKRSPNMAKQHSQVKEIEELRDAEEIDSMEQNV